MGNIAGNRGIGGIWGGGAPNPFGGNRPTGGMIGGIGQAFNPGAGAQPFNPGGAVGGIMNQGQAMQRPGMIGQISPGGDIQRGIAGLLRGRKP